MHDKNQPIQINRPEQRVSRQTQRGTTIIEVVIVLILMGVLISILYLAVGGADVERNRATALVRHMQILRTAVEGQGTILGCYPQNVEAMVDEPTFVTAAGNTCQTANPVLRARFFPPYIRNVAQDDDGIILDDILPGARGEIAVEFPTGGVPRAFVRYQISNITEAMALQIWRVCSNVDDNVDPADTDLDFISNDFNDPCYITGGATTPSAGMFVGEDGG